MNHFEAPRQPIDETMSIDDKVKIKWQHQIYTICGTTLYLPVWPFSVFDLKSPNLSSPNEISKIIGVLSHMTHEHFFSFGLYNIMVNV